MKTLYKQYKLGDLYSSDFDYAGMLLKASEITIDTPLTTLTKLANSMRDVNYHSLCRALNVIIGKYNVSDITIEDDIKTFHTLVQDEIMDI